MKTSFLYLSMIFLISIGLFGCADEPNPDLGDIGQNDTLPPPQDGTGSEDTTASVLVFTKTLGYRHSSIEKGVNTIKSLGGSNKFTVTQTEDSGFFTKDGLSKYQLVIFLSTTQDVLNSSQQEVFQDYIKNGGNFMGIHAATDTEYDWGWYGKLVGAYFKSHPEVQEAQLIVADKNHPATAHLGDNWTHTDEWYNFKDLNPQVNVLLKLDESSYSGGENGGEHPIAWYHQFEGGRSFYTGLGHTEEAYDNPDFQKHLLGGIQYCLGRTLDK
ncbi:ThuA domain-containing protein [Zeaxanthinibacter sp. PT1]|uniref:ThuA domain-containing protein n=1 Tax=Zeaxanthinibacter TaxID=561554 RepID=UPI0023495AA3|nr:ThuA domain-containing protein [Zeaxanthinibacter sp. PT1]MDC6350510.1 ThuA domain-containing protein [Zeaxanthinibacter sp. PT1]